MAVVQFLLLIVSYLQWSDGIAQEIYPVQIKQSDQCDYDDLLLELLEIIYTALRYRIPLPECISPSTCREILHCNSYASSGYYQIQAADGSALQVYCDMEGTYCGGEGGWMRLAHLNMTDPSSQCPVGFRVETVNDTRFCIRDTNTSGCHSISLTSFGLTYSQVCGYVRGYSFATTNAFGPFHRTSNEPLSGNYVDGVSITYGTPPTHIWTYAAATGENASAAHERCPCYAGDPGVSAPSYVGNDYYCEAGFFRAYNSLYAWYTSDLLWDGAQCGGDEGPCCNHTGLPWFYKSTPTPTIADINIRICLDEETYDENIGLEGIEFFVK